MRNSTTGRGCRSSNPIESAVQLRPEWDHIIGPLAHSPDSSDSRPYPGQVTQKRPVAYRKKWLLSFLIYFRNFSKQELDFEPHKENGLEKIWNLHEFAHNRISLNQETAKIKFRIKPPKLGIHEQD